ncbi:AAA family ATPase, partial [Treponema endosymbiont of Eucomonympha sp.]|uniref:AAA family ATPase n=1 Tax=Treponema endosymbiont of Eucomonympha sp. TaxID=1580831 RepID=UPI000A7551AF
QIIASMKEIGYDIGDIRVSANPALVPPIPLDPNSYPLMLYVVEKTSKVAFFQNQMSQGMFRAFSLITQLTYNVLSKSSSTVLIDDIGEGLDFERSSGIIKLITRLAEKSGTQLIMSTNDRFVMNNVSLEYWQVIQRTGGECKVFNYQNSKEKFDEFEYTGLSNFDFLKTDFINSKRESA